MAEFETIDEYRRIKYPGMEKPWSQKEKAEFLKRKEKLSKLVDDMKKRKSDSRRRAPRRTGLLGLNFGKSVRFG